MRYLFHIIIPAIIFLGCGQKNEEIKPSKEKQRADSLANLAFTKVREYTPLVEIDTLKDSRQQIYLAHNNDRYVLVDSALQDTFRLSPYYEKIMNAMTSPTGKYIVCEISYIPSEVSNDHNLKPRQDVPRWEYVFINTNTSQIIRRIGPPESKYLRLKKWVSKSRLLFYASDDIAILSYHFYDAFRDSLYEVPDEYVELN
jgi:hypothetical protein